MDNVVLHIILGKENATRYFYGAWIIDHFSFTHRRDVKERIDRYYRRQKESGGKKIMFVCRPDVIQSLIDYFDDNPDELHFTRCEVDRDGNYKKVEITHQQAKDIYEMGLNID